MKDLGCESGHSWAWITPDGDFIPVDNHTLYAWGIRDDDAVLARFMQSDVRDYGPYGELFAKHILKNEDDGTPPGLVSGQVMSIPKDVQALAVRLGLPNLSQGSWGVRVRLTPQEERFIHSVGVHPERVSVTPDNARNRKVRGAWKEYRSSIMRDLQRISHVLLMEKGWVKVSNAYAIGTDSDWEITPTQYNTFFREVLSCWKRKGIRPEVDREKINIAIGRGWWDLSYAEALDRFVDRKLADEFYEHLLGGRSTESFESRLKNWTDRDWNKLRDNPLSEDEIEREQTELEAVNRAIAPKPVPNPKPERKPKPKPRRTPYRPRYASAARVAARYASHVISPDHHLTDPDTGLYRWTPERVSAAWVRSTAELDEALRAGGVSKVVLMVGIPASGKTTWLSANAEPGVIYFDATFKDSRARRPILDVVRRYGVPVEAVVMATPIDEAIRRNNTRTPDRRVPDEVLVRMYRDLTGGGMPSRSEGFVRVTVVRPSGG